MSDKTKIPRTIRMVIDLPIETHTDMAVECYCCGNPSNAAISRLASLVLHHAWQDLGSRKHSPYWLSSVFAEIEEL